MKTIIITLLTTLLSCNQYIKFPVSTVLPAAEAEVKISRDDNQNYVIDLKVNNMASPDRLPEPKQFYVVWISDEAGKIHNVGMLLSDKNNNASLLTTTPFNPVDIFVTAEDSGNVTVPGFNEVLRASILAS